MNNTTAGNGPLDRYNFHDDGPAEAPPKPAYSAWERPDTIPWQHELLVLFLRNQLRVAPAMPILALLLAATSLLWVPWFISAGWLVGAIGCQAFQLFLCKRYFHRERTRDEQSDW